MPHHQHLLMSSDERLNEEMEHSEALQFLRNDETDDEDLLTEQRDGSGSGPVPDIALLYPTLTSTKRPTLVPNLRGRDNRPNPNAVEETVEETAPAASAPNVCNVSMGTVLFLIAASGLRWHSFTYFGHGPYI